MLVGCVDLDVVVLFLVVDGCVVFVDIECDVGLF